MIYLMYAVSMLLSLLCGYLFYRVKKVTKEGIYNVNAEIQKRNVTQEIMNGQMAQLEADLKSTVKLLENHQLFITYSKKIAQMRDSISNKDQEIRDLNELINLLKEANQQLLTKQGV